ncbi:MAG: hypothetical protein FWE54_00680 [Methanimicrococcus sp.]|nr:hypothetical protein [Methanimicrococcus sp.]
MSNPKIVDEFFKKEMLFVSVNFVNFFSQSLHGKILNTLSAVQGLFGAFALKLKL